MAAEWLRYATIILLVFIYLLGISLSVVFNTDFGNVDVKLVSIPYEELQLSGLLYRPLFATTDNPRPAIVVAHGLSSNKQMMSGITSELARQGFVTLALDLIGHGNSEGAFQSSRDPTLGISAAVRYLGTQPFVTSSLIGLVGHSLGAGAIRATAVAHGNITASVFIGGGVGAMVTGPAYGSLNSTFPKNLLIAIGRLDVLFDLSQLKTELSQVFGTAQEIVTGRLYGNFSLQTARKLITPTTTHIFEPADPAIVSEIIYWMSTSLKVSNLQDNARGKSLVYPYREVAISTSLVAFIGFVFPISQTIFNRLPATSQRQKSKERYGFIEDWKVLVIWGVLGLGLFLPMVFLGFAISIPPLIFGSSFAWWLLGVAIAGLFLILYVLPRFSTIEPKIRSVISDSFNLSSLLAVSVMFVILYSIVYVTESASTIDLCFIVPMFSTVKPNSRILMFLMFLPFFLVYFFVEGLYLHEFRQIATQKIGFKSRVLSISKTVGIKVCPYIVVLGVQYIPMLLFDVRAFPTFVGFLMEFLWGIIPLFAISTVYSWWLYRNTSAIGAGAVFNSLLFAWSAAGIFPF